LKIWISEEAGPEATIEALMSVLPYSWDRRTARPGHPLEDGPHRAAAATGGTDRRPARPGSQTCTGGLLRTVTVLARSPRSQRREACTSCKAIPGECYDGAIRERRMLVLSAELLLYCPARHRNISPPLRKSCAAAGTRIRQEDGTGVPAQPRHPPIPRPLRASAGGHSGAIRTRDRHNLRRGAVRRLWRVKGGWWAGPAICLRPRSFDRDPPWDLLAPCWQQRIMPKLYIY
jgi:hypothetical protein